MENKLYYFIMEGVKVPVSDTPWDNPGDVDGGVLLLPAHHVEAQSFLCLGQLNHPSHHKPDYRVYPSIFWDFNQSTTAKNF
jgi:hypothetical protein